MTASDHAMPDSDSTVTFDWKPDWPTVRQHVIDWWAGDGLVLRIDAPADRPHLADMSGPPTPDDLIDRYLNPAYRAQRALYHLSRQAMVGDYIPIADTNVGAGDLAAMLGCEWAFAPSTVWYHPCIEDPDTHPLFTLDRDSQAMQRLKTMTQRCVEVAQGRYFVGITDLIENLDILSALRDPQTLMMDLIERPEWVLDSIEQINQVWFEAFDMFYDIVKAPDGSCAFAAFNVWGPGKTAKVQCDAAAMISADMFSQFVVPALTRQCQWLDYSMYHLDGEDCLNCLDALLAIEPLNAVEWTPRMAYAGEGGGHPKWYDLYKRILEAGKSVQAISVQPEQVLPLLDAVGGRGMYICTHAKTQTQAQQLYDQVAAYR